MKPMVLTVYDKLSEKDSVSAMNSEVSNPPLGSTDSGSVDSECLVGAVVSSYCLKSLDV